MKKGLMIIGVLFLLTMGIALLGDLSSPDHECRGLVSSWQQRTDSHPRRNAFEQMVKNCMTNSDAWR